MATAVKGTGKKRRITDPATGRFRWVPIEDGMEDAVVVRGAAPPEPDEADEEPEEPEGFDDYWHPYLPNLVIRRGRKDQIKFRGGVYTPRTAEEEQRVRQALRKYVPGRDPDRWKGTTIFDRNGNPKERRCRECGFFTSNDDVMEDHLRKTQHMSA